MSVLLCSIPTVWKDVDYLLQTTKFTQPHIRHQLPSRSTQLPVRLRRIRRGVRHRAPPTRTARRHVRRPRLRGGRLHCLPDLLRVRPGAPQAPLQCGQTSAERLYTSIRIVVVRLGNAAPSVRAPPSPASPPPAPAGPGRTGHLPSGRAGQQCEHAASRQARRHQRRQRLRQEGLTVYGCGRGRGARLLTARGQLDRVHTRRSGDHGVMRSGAAAGGCTGIRMINDRETQTVRDYLYSEGLFLLLC